MKTTSIQECSPCVSWLNNLCSKQVKQANIFKSYRTNQVLKLFHDRKCKSGNLIYLLQCGIYKLRYVGKSETTFNIPLNNYWKDAKSEKSILVCKHFNESDHNVQKHPEFTLIEQIRKQTTTEETKKLLKIWENF